MAAASQGPRIAPPSRPAARGPRRHRRAPRSTISRAGFRTPSRKSEPYARALPHSKNVQTACRDSYKTASRLDRTIPSDTHITRNRMRSLPHIFTRFGTAVVILALSILSACNDRNLVAPLGGDPGVGPLTTVDVLYCAGPGAPAWVAFQDGEGAWTTATPILDGRHAVYRHSFAANHGGIAAGQRFSGLTTLNVIYGAPAELAAFGNTFPGDCDSSAPKAILGTIAGLADNQVATVTGGFSSAFIFPGDHSFVLTDLSNEPQTILATRTTRVNDVLTLDKLILRRTPVLPDSATIPVLDFNSDEAFAPAVANVTIEGLAPEGARTLTKLVTPNSQSIISFLSNSTTAATRSYNAIPESKLGPNDVQALIVSGHTTPELTVR